MTLQQKLKTYRLSQAEFEKASSLMGHPLVGVEWAIFSALWSEHCSYKSSKVHLRKFKYRNNNTPDLNGENAGIVDLGLGEKIIFKMESHNHPSFIEPFHGAATGVGGILRDIFTMGARPIALADYLCFGELEAPRMKSLLAGVVKGISSYGNCVGVPTVTGKTFFSRAYNNNILVNAMAVGLLQEGEPVAFSKAQGLGNKVVYVGAKTGKDGVHGASMASEAFDQDLEKKKPNVQIGDPFYEKLLIEACLDVLKQNLVVAMQDMGAAGLTSSSFEMAEKGGVGLDLDLDKVPTREADMTPEEILLSESQERMLMVVEPKNVDEIQNVFSRWGLDAVVIGEVTAGPEICLYWRGDMISQIDPRAVVGNAPVYERPFQTSAPAKELFVKKTRLQDFFKAWSGAARLQDKMPIYQQYDQRVGARTEWSAEAPVAVLRLPSGRRLGMALGCNPSWMSRDYVTGSLEAFVNPYLRLCLAGLKPMAMTDCLNFGSPENIQIMTEFVTSVDHLALCSEVFDVPVISGNVSFYNETMGQQITSTPAVGMVAVGEQSHSLPSYKIESAENKVWLVWGPHLEKDQLSETKAWGEKINTFAKTQNKNWGAQLISEEGLYASLAKTLSKNLGLKLKIAAEDFDIPPTSLLIWSDTQHEIPTIFADQKAVLVAVTTRQQGIWEESHGMTCQLPQQGALL